MRDMMPNIIASHPFAELIATEKSYKASLDKLIEFFNGQRVTGSHVTQLRQALTGLQRASAEIICNLEETIRGLNTEDPDLNKRISLTVERRVLLDAFFTRLKEYLRVYKNVQSILTASKAGSGLIKLRDMFLKQTGSDMSSLLIMPVQRAPRYRLLIEALLQDKSLVNETQRGILLNLLETTKPLIDESNTLQEALDREAEKSKTFELSDIRNGTYQFGSIFRLLSSFVISQDDTILHDTIASDPSEDPNSPSEEKGSSNGLSKG